MKSLEWRTFLRMVLTLSPVIINQHGNLFFTALFKGSVFILKDELKHIPIFSRYF